jgi:hypothetical protein
MSDEKTLIDEICEAAKRTRKLGWINYCLAYTVAFVAVAGSVTATILAATKEAPGWLTAIIAAIPATVLAVNTTFNFERKGLWHWRTTKRFEALVRELQYENAEEAAVSKKFSETDLDTFDGWIAYSSLSRASSVNSQEQLTNQPRATG